MQLNNFKPKPADLLAISVLPHRPVMLLRLSMLLQQLSPMQPNKMGHMVNYVFNTNSSYTTNKRRGSEIVDEEELANVMEAKQM